MIEIKVGQRWLKNNREVVTIVSTTEDNSDAVDSLPVMCDQGWYYTRKGNCLGGVEVAEESLAALVEDVPNGRIKLKKIHPSAITPEYATVGSAAFDISVHGADWSDSEKRFGKCVGQDYPVIFKTGLALEIPEGYVLLIFSRSGHGFKHDVRLSNCVGVIDSDYRGELMVKLTGDSTATELTVLPGDRIAQGLLVAVPRVTFDLVDSLSTTERGEGGFGSTGN